MKVKWKMCVGRKSGFVPIYKPSTQDVLVPPRLKKRRHVQFVKNPVMLKRFAIALTILLTSANWCAADNHQKQFYLVQPYAVPVAVPVSPYAPFTYSTSAQQQQAYNEPPRSDEDMLYDRFVKRLNAASQPPATVFSTTCIACHAKPASVELGAPKFTTLGALTGDQLDHAEDAVLNDRMPLGGKLTADQAGKLLKEFSGERMRRKSVTKPRAQSDVPPAPPSPEELGESQ